MILYSTQVKLQNRSTMIEFSIEFTNPTSAEITWYKDPEQPALGFNKATARVTNQGDGIFRLEHFIQAQEFWIKLNTEPRKLRYENLYTFKINADKPLKIYPGYNTTLSLPYSNLADINIELSTIDGNPLEVWGEGTLAKFWSEQSSEITNEYGKPKLIQNILFHRSASVREKGASWQTLNDFSSIYVRVTNLRNVISNDILRNTYIDESDYESSWGGIVDYSNA